MDFFIGVESICIKKGNGDENLMSFGGNSDSEIFERKSFEELIGGDFLQKNSSVVIHQLLGKNFSLLDNNNKLSEIFETLREQI